MSDPAALPDDPRWRDAAGLRWLFVDLNAYFASVEQQKRSELRGQPVIVRPSASEHTSAIAVSYEAKAHGVKTGMKVAEARRLCPGLHVIDARPDVYVQVHKKILEAIESCLPIHRVCSIDEAACRLAGPDRLEANAVALARRVQAAILDEVGPCLGSSVGLAPSRLLAKLACDMKKPRGLTVLRAADLPGPLLGLQLGDIPGVGPRMALRLEAAGVRDMAALWALGARDARAVWGSIEGERLWRGLRGEDAAEAVEAPRASISHGHVLGGAMRAPEKARATARRLAVKCGARLRRMEATGAQMSLRLDLAEPRGSPRSHRRGLVVERAFPASCDTFMLLRALDALWDEAAPRLGGRPLRYVGVGVARLAYGEPAPDLLGWTPGSEDNPRTLALSRSLDALNTRFGKDTVTIGPNPRLPAFVGAKIVFGRIPEDAEFKE